MNKLYKQKRSENKK